MEIKQAISILKKDLMCCEEDPICERTPCHRCELFVSGEDVREATRIVIRYVEEREQIKPEV